MTLRLMALRLMTLRLIKPSYMQAKRVLGLTLKETLNNPKAEQDMKDLVRNLKGVNGNAKATDKSIEITSEFTDPSLTLH